MKKIFCLILIMALILCAASCKNSIISKKEEETTKSASDNKTTEKRGTGKLSLYFCYSDSLNPYDAESSGNQNIASLIFDPLVKLDKNLNPQYVIANSVKCEGKRVYISLNSYYFSDGSTVTSEDVTYSISKAMKSKNGLYVNQLENVSSYSAASTYEVELVLKHEDRNVINTLDFPIIKSDSCDQTNDDGKAISPIGSGRYVFVDNSGNFSLKGNSNYHGTVPKNTIVLKNTPDSDALEFLIKSKTINLYYTHTDSESNMQLSSNTNSVKLTNLVYLGVNSKNTYLSDSNIRKAIAYSVNRNQIAEKSYFSLASAATSLFLKDSEIREKTSNIFSEHINSKNSSEALSKAGYTTLNKQGIYENSDGESINISLVYNSDNEIQTLTANTVIKGLKVSGINVQLRGLKTSVYKNAIKNGDYDIYLAEIKLNKNFDYTAMFDKTKNITGYKSSTASSKNVLKQYQNYLTGTTSVQNFLNVFAEEMPFIPLVFRLGTLSYTDNLSPAPTASISDPYYNIEQISVK